MRMKRDLTPVRQSFVLVFHVFINEYKMNFFIFNHSFIIYENETDFMNTLYFLLLILNFLFVWTKNR